MAMKKAMDEEQRARRNQYLREYRARNPQRTKQWRMNYIRRAAARMAEAEQRGGDSDARRD